MRAKNLPTRFRPAGGPFEVEEVTTDGLTADDTNYHDSTTKQHLYLYCTRSMDYD